MLSTKSSRGEYSVLFVPRCLPFPLLFLHYWCSHLAYGNFSVLSKKCSLAIILEEVNCQRMIFLSFPSSEDICISPSFLKDMFTRYRILRWQFFSLCALKMLCYFFPPPWCLVRNPQPFEFLCLIGNASFFSHCFQDCFLCL